MTKDVFRWSLYDFANSVLFIVFVFYFPQWLVIDQRNPAWWFNVTLVASSILFILCAPRVAAHIDRTGKKIEGLRVWTGVTLLTFLVLACISLFLNNLDLFAAGLFAFGMFAYLMCFLYYSPILNDISNTENRGRVSGIATTFNFAGQVTGLLITLPLVNGSLLLFGGSPRAETLLPAVLVMAILVIPMLLLCRDKTPIEVSTTTSFKVLFRSVFSSKSLALLLIAFFFFSDALLTFSSNFTLYLEEVFAASDTTKSLLGIGILFFAAIGALISGYLADKFGSKKVFIIVLGLWIVLFTAASLTTSLAVIIPLFALGGLLFGPVWSITRAMVGDLLAPEAVASSYSYFVVIERFATFIGPLTWSGILLVAGEGKTGYQLAVFSMGILVFISILILRKVNGPAPKTLRS